MTPAELELPWRTFEGMPATWRLVVRASGRERTLVDTEVLDLCAAVELERVHAGNVGALLAARAKGRKRWTFEQLVDGAHGLARSSAPGELSLGDVLRRVGCELVRSEVRVDDAREEQA